MPGKILIRCAVYTTVVCYPEYSRCERFPLLSCGTNRHPCYPSYSKPLDNVSSGSETGRIRGGECLHDLFEIQCRWQHAFSFGSERFLKNKSFVFSSLQCNVCLLDSGLDAELSQIQT